MLRPRMLSILARYKIPAADGDDLLQDALLATLKRWEDIENIEAWLLSVLRHQCCNYQRRRSCWSRIVQPMDPAELQAISFPLEPPQELLEVQCDLQRLRPELCSDERHLLFLWFSEDLGRKEIASRIGCHPANVPKVIRRVLARLKAAAQRPLL